MSKENLKFHLKSKLGKSGNTQYNKLILKCKLYQNDKIYYWKNELNQCNIYCFTNTCFNDIHELQKQLHDLKKTFNLQSNDLYIGFYDDNCGILFILTFKFYGSKYDLQIENTFNNTIYLKRKNDSINDSINENNQDINQDIKDDEISIINASKKINIDKRYQNSLEINML